MHTPRKQGGGNQAPVAVAAQHRFVIGIHVSANGHVIDADGIEQALDRIDEVREARLPEAGRPCSDDPARGGDQLCVLGADQSRVVGCGRRQVRVRNHHGLRRDLHDAARDFEGGVRQVDDDASAIQLTDN